MILHPDAWLLNHLVEHSSPPHLAEHSVPTCRCRVTTRAVAGGPGRAECSAEDVVAPDGADEL